MDPLQNASSPPPDHDAWAPARAASAQPGEEGGSGATVSSGPLLFLSHAGVDTNAALKLALALEATPAAREAGLKVWIDQRDLIQGPGWQAQLEDVIHKSSTAFAVLVGARGVVNWVESEVRVALSRATGNPAYPFIPILVGEARSADLPVFARQYEAVRGPSATDPVLMQALLGAVLQRGSREVVMLVEHPFVGLKSFDQATAQLFFGRSQETGDLVGRLQRTNLLMVVGDSGSGKSSLVKAGLVPQFRGGAFADPSGDQPDRSLWQVIEMRPQGQPFKRLVDAVGQAATAAGRELRDVGTLKDWVRTRDPLKIRDAVRDSASVLSKALLVVDQFEELWTLSSEVDRRDFITALLGLAEAAGTDCRIVLTMRRDYYNLCSQFPSLFQRLEAADGAAKYPVRRMQDAALREAITGPMLLTEAAQHPERVASFADAVLDDVSDRPGDLALLAMALAETWRHRREHGGNLLASYVVRGRVAGALANAAEEVFQAKLSKAPSDLVKGVFVRLVWLGDTGGTTRRIARRAEFSDETWQIVQRLAGAGDEPDRPLARLIAIAGEPGSETVEIVQEVLVTQWPRYQAWLEDAALDKRVFDRLSPDEQVERERLPQEQQRLAAETARTAPAARGRASATGKLSLAAVGGAAGAIVGGAVGAAVGALAGAAVGYIQAGQGVSIAKRFARTRKPRVHIGYEVDDGALAKERPATDIHDVKGGPPAEQALDAEDNPFGTESGTFDVWLGQGLYQSFDDNERELPEELSRLVEQDRTGEQLSQHRVAEPDKEEAHRYRKLDSDRMSEDAVAALHAANFPRSAVASAASGAEPVDAAVSCPPRVVKGSDFLAQIFLYQPEVTAEVQARAQEADATAERRGVFSLPFELLPGTRVDLRLEMPGLTVAEPDAVFVWRGRPVAAQFEVAIPADTKTAEAIGRVRFAVAGIPAGTLRFKVALAALGTPVVEPAALREAEATRFRKAFVSYSSQDRAEVLRRVQAFRIAGLSVFQDLLDLEPGERWERGLHHEIDGCDVFLLFWSRAAAASEWVAKEISYALERKAGSDDCPPAIQPVPIEGPPPPPPPEVLRHLHFNDALLAHIQAATSAANYGSLQGSHGSAPHA